MASKVGKAPPASQELGPALHVLALSGGGFRALYTATILKHIEESIGAPIASRFDLLCGTSAGGLLALGLAAELPAAELQEMFEQDGHLIFCKRDPLRKLFGPWLKAKHSADGLRAVLTARFRDLTIGSLRHRVLVPAVNYSSGKGQFFKTPHAPAFVKDYKRTLVDVGLATTAAPTYFPLHRIDEEGVFVDGGLVGNAPGLFGWHEAKEFLPTSPATRIRVLSIGTMTLGTTIRGSASLDRGIALWRSALFDLVISAQEASVDYMLKQVLGEDYFQIDDLATPAQSRDIGSLDKVTEGTINVLKDRGTQAARRALGNPRLETFKSHMAKSPVFFHGPNKNCGGQKC